MWVQRDFDLKSVQSFANSKEEVIKQTMVKHDMAFRNQVHELHRLYGVQKSLMKDLSGKDDGWYYPWDKAQSFVATFRDKRDPLLKDSTSFSATKAVSSSYMGQDLLNSYQDACFILQKRSLNLQLSADEFIELDEGNLPNRRKFVNFLQVDEDSGHLISVDNPSGAEDLNLSLCIGVNRTIAGDATRNCFNKKVCSSSPIVIDLEDSVDNVSDVYSCRPLGCTTPQSHFNGTKVCSNDVSHANISTKIKQPSLRGYELDLNKVHTDESSHYSDDLIVTSFSTACSSGNQAGNNDNRKNGEFPDPINWQHEIRDMVLAGEVVNPAAENFDSNNGSMNSGVANLKIRDLMSLPTLGTSKSHSCCGDDMNEVVDLKMNAHKNLPPSSDHVSAVTTPRAGSCEGSDADSIIISCVDQSQIICQDEHGIKSPESVKSYSVSDNDSTNAKAKHCGIRSGVCNKFSETESGTQMSNVLSGEHHVRNFNQTESKSESAKNKAETSQVEVLMEIAAESLLLMYLDKSSGQDLRTEMLPKDIQNEEMQEPQCSVDSYEMTVLKLTEEANCDSATSNAFQVNYEETKDFGLTLRRGRRMKNFQREILPGLATLARHEISEDITIMEGVLKSREYRKMRAKMKASGQKWSTPVRSKRSRLSYVRRRIFA